jgi:twitching motility protein PilT
MHLDELVGRARERGASDLHLESGRPAVLRINGELQPLEDSPRGRWLMDEIRTLLGREGWAEFSETKSFDFSRNIAGVRCRVNVFKSNRGLAVAVRLLSSFQASLRRLNLHPSLADFVDRRSGLVIFSGPTGCGKSTTMAALIEETNRRFRRHVLTLEQPIEYAFTPKRAMIRQREVPTDTPSFRQGLIDSLREDPDLIMVGEMRDPDTMRLTLNAAETGHLVFATVHSGSAAEALQRLTSAFPAELQRSVAAQLADCLAGVVCQRLAHRPDLGFRVAECEILHATPPVRALVRAGKFNKIADAIQTGAAEGMFSFERYRQWLQDKPDWSRPMAPAAASSEDALPSEAPPVDAPLPRRSSRPAKSRPAERPVADGVIEIGGDEDLGEVLAELEGH